MKWHYHTSMFLSIPALFISKSTPEQNEETWEIWLRFAGALSLDLPAVPGPMNPRGNGAVQHMLQQGWSLPIPVLILLPILPILCYSLLHLIVHLFPLCTLSMQLLSPDTNIFAPYFENKTIQDLEKLLSI